VDGLLGAAIEDESYNLATRETGGFDGNAYPGLNAAIQAAREGDTILIRTGTYYDTVDWSGSGNEVCFIVNKGVTISPYNGEAVTLTYDPLDPPLSAPGSEDDYGPIIQIDAQSTGQLVTLDGIKTLTIVGTRTLKAERGVDVDINIRIGENSRNVTIKRCAIQDGGHCGIKFGSANTVIIEQNMFADTGVDSHDHHIYISEGADSEDHRIMIRHNTFTTAKGKAIQLFGAGDYVDVYGNVIYGNLQNAITVSGDHVRLCNNTVVLNGAEFLERTGLEIWKGEVTTFTCVNNIFLWNQVDDIFLDDPAGLPTAATISHNIYGVADSSVGYLFDDYWLDDGTDQDVDTATYDPGFVDDPIVDWTGGRLGAESPLIADGGVSVFDTLLDPAITDWPTPKTVIGTLPIGAFAAS
jgi:hypothetical protein